MSAPRRRGGAAASGKGARGRRGGPGASRDPMDRFHDEWLGMVQPIDGLVVSKPALREAQVARPDDKTLRDRLLSHLTTPDPASARIVELLPFFADLLALGPERWIAGAQLPEAFRLAIPDTGQRLEPTAALVRQPDTAPVALLWELPPGLPLDARETVTGGWDYPPAAKLDRLLRHAGVAIGLLNNGTHVRLMYAPHGASTGAITFPVGAMARSDGRPILDAFVMLLHATRWFGVAPAHQLPALLAASREAQGQVTKALADQVLEALHLLLAAFAQAGAGGEAAFLAAYRDPELGEDHVYAGLLTFMLRLVFVLYAEDNGLLPVEEPFYAEHLSALALYEELAADAGAVPDAMARRFGAYGRLLSLFRAIFFGVAHGSLRMPPRHGDLFSPHTYGFLEGNREPSSPHLRDADGRRRVQVPAIDDETIYRVLRSLLVLGEERLSYKALDVEQIGSVYENLMGYRVIELGAPAVCLKKTRAWIVGEELAGQAPGARARWLQEEAGLPKADADRAAKSTAGVRKADDLLEALIEGGHADAHSRRAAGRFVIQPGEERRRSGSHYTPRSLTAPIVEKTLAPLLAALPRPAVKKGAAPAEGPSSEALLSLKICDPAMGSGAFLVEVVRQLGDHVVAAWRREGRAGALLPSHGPAHDTETAAAQARRLVAQRCVYGVDRNPQAVTLAKLSLWLVTLAKDKPFSFVDHALRCGDSLVGLSIDQITGFHWKGGQQGEQRDLIDREIRDVLDEAVRAREAIAALARDDSPEGQREKERLLRDAEDAVGRLRILGDLVLGAFFSSTSDKEREAERVRRRDLVAAWLGSGRGDSPELMALAEDFRRRIPAFHWMIELPEVFWVKRPDPLNRGAHGGQAWMDGFVGNPPFAGKNSLLALEGGESLLAWLKHVHPGAHGNADYSAHFFRRCDHLIGDHGALGLIATNTIAQGDTRATGLQALVAGGAVIYDAIRTLPWPGAAAVTVSVVHVARGSASRELTCLLEGAPVARINSRLRVGDERPDPVALRANAGKSYVGSYVLGMGFVLTPEERRALIQKNRKNEDRIFPYLGGEEVNSHPTQEFDRYVINFGDMTLEEAGRWPDLLAIVREKVKPERDLNNREVRKKYWWRFGETTPALYAALAPLDRCLVTGIVSKHLLFSFQPAKRTFSHKLYVFPLGREGIFAALQSRVHAAWTWLLSSTMKTDLNYSASDCFETFPFPIEPALAALDFIGEQLYAARAHYMAATWQGLTTIYNQLKDPGYTGDLAPASAERPSSVERGSAPWAPPTGLPAAVPALASDPALHQPETRVAVIHHLRHLHEALDRAVLAAYGWSDIAVPPFCPPRPDDHAGHAAVALFEDTIIDRLFALNAARAAEEAALAGAPAPAARPAIAAAKRRGPRAKESAAQPSLLDDES
jgi:hypothetical protein